MVNANVAVGIFFDFYPAKNAANLDPVEALCYDDLGEAAKLPVLTEVMFHYILGFTKG